MNYERETPGTGNTGGSASLRIGHRDIGEAPTAGKRLQGIGAAKRFVELLTADPGNPLSWRLIHDSDKRAEAINLDSALDNLMDTFLERQDAGYGVFAVVNGGGHRDTHINKVRAVFVDGDDLPVPQTWHVEPHFLVQRDDTHWHAYWLTKSTTPEQFTEVQRRLAVMYGTDPTISNTSRVMRVPGFVHQKGPDDPRDVTLIERNTRLGGRQKRYSYEEMSAGLPYVPHYVTLSRKLDPNRDRPVCELDLGHNIEVAEKFLLRREPAIEGQHGNRWTYETACFVRDFGISEPLCNEVLLNSEWNQERCEPAWPADELAVVVANAYRYSENRAGCKRAPVSVMYDIKGARPMDLDEYREWRERWLRRSECPADRFENTLAVGEDRPLSASELASGDFPRAEHLWRDFILKGHPNSIDGDGGVGKTQVLIQIAAAVASGRSLFGHEVIQSPVLLVLCEDDYGEVKHRLEGACAALGVELKDLPIEVWCRPGEDSTLAIVDDNGAWTCGPFYELLDARLKEISPCFLGLDTISDVAILDENKRLPVNTFAKQVLGGLCRKYGSTTLVTRHPSKSSVADGTYYSGSTAANAAFRNRLVLKAEERGDGRTLKVAKSNYGLRGEVSLHHSGRVLRSFADLERKQMEQAEREAVFELLRGLRASGVTVVPSHGNGHKPKDLAPLLKEKYGLDLDAKTVLGHLRSLQSNQRIHWLASKPGKNGREATFEVGPLPDDEGEPG